MRESYAKLALDRIAIRVDQNAKNSCDRSRALLAAWVS